jgi:hypothetical protein
MRIARILARLLNAMHLCTLVLVFALAGPAVAGGPATPKPATPPAASRLRVLVSTDIGGSDPDDYQSMVHLLVCADAFDIEGLVSSPFGPGQGSRATILQVIDKYAQDYPNLKTYSEQYPTPEALRAITKQGALSNPGYEGFGKATEGSSWIVTCARREDPRPLHVLVWGNISDLAQALHDAPDILPKLRVHFIGGPNKMWNVDSYDFLWVHCPTLHIIEDNSTYVGQFVGGNQSDDWGNKTFVRAHIAGRGALGEFFASLRGGALKMGDTPTVAGLLHGDPDDPSKPGWGGRFVRAWDGRKVTFDRITTEAEFAIPLPAGMTRNNTSTVSLDSRVPCAVENDGHVLRFRLSPKSARVWSYTFRSDFPGLDGTTGRITAVLPTPAQAATPSPTHPNWWTDDPDPALAERGTLGAKTVNRWRADFLRDFAARMQRCQAAKGTPKQ